MMPRNLLLPAAFVAAVGIPLMAFRPGDGGLDGSGGASGHVFTEGAKNAVELFGSENESFFVPISDWAELIRFDVYPNWVKSRWPRVSTAPASDGLQGMRVALVTGSNHWDVCGALTYYFDENLRVQRISLIGDTGDASLLVKHLVERYQFRVHQTQSAGLLTAASGRRTYGVLKLENPTVILASDPQRQVRVLLEINNPDGDRGLSDAMVAQLQGNRY